jgi:uncharacterized protein
MELVHEKSAHPHYVISVETGKLRIGEVEYSSSLVVSLHDIIPDWPPRSIDDLALAHFETILAWRPELVLLGTGETSLMPSPEYLAWFNSRGIGFESMTTPAACRTFNVLLEEGREVAAALIL